ncbi:MAG: hypothetical protein Q4E21_05305 [Clostridia bacterium]|nr:hypothetical protein [Clostridia bacterium]
MKKILAVVLALTMLFALCVPAFAADPNPITKDTAQAGSADVITTFVAADETYSVSYPAAVNVAWGDTAAQDAKYTVTSALQIGAKITVSATENAGGTMTAAGTADTLTFTVQNGAAQDFTGANAAVDSSTTVTIADFSGAAVGEYTGTMTYTVVYTAPTP